MINTDYILYSSSWWRSIFNHPGWFAACKDALEEDAIQMLELKSSQGYWPFVRRRGGIKELGAYIVEPLGVERTDYVAPIASANNLESFLASVAEELARLLGPYSVLVLPKLVLNKEHLDRFVAYLQQHGLSNIQIQSRQVWRMAFASSWQEQSKGWPKKHRGDINRCLRRLRERGELSLFVALSPAQVKERLETMFTKHEARWAKDGIASEFRQARNRRFFYSLLKHLPFDYIHYSEVRLDDTPISYHFGFRDNGWLLWYKPTYDPDYGKFSPGKVHLALLTQEGITQGMKGIDFLQGDEGYKKLWANDSIETYSIVAAKRSAFLPFYWQTGLRERAKQIALNVAKQQQRFVYRLRGHNNG